jgi:hypothetical protein
MRPQVTEIIQKAGSEQEGAAGDQPVQTSVGPSKPQDDGGAANVNGDTAQQWGWGAVPAILAWHGDQAVRARPTRNQWCQAGGDAESDSKTAREQDEVAR